MVSSNPNLSHRPNLQMLPTHQFGITVLINKLSGDTLKTEQSPALGLH